MTDAIQHRGPDDEGYFIDKNVGLGFRRLSIIDLNTGHQPLSNIDGSIHIVFNGEIYNFIEQRDILKQKRYSFRTATDTEVILHLYEEYGVDCLQYLRGMFAFAIWDSKKKQLFCARDRFGIKPFFYYTDKQKFAFGSEIKAILGCTDIDRTFSKEAMDSYFAFGYITSDLSIYRNVKKLQPGHYLLLSLKDKVSIEIKRYWEIHFEPDFSKSENQWIDEIESCLSETIRMHMISDVPLGAFLSGGIDSSSVVSMMARNSNLPIKTFSIGFKEKKYNELGYAREVSAKYGCEHHEQIIEPDTVSLLPALVRGYDEPFADSSAIPTYLVSKFAREHVTVVLSGDGGDELFAGYDIHSYLFNISKVASSIPVFNKFFWGNIHKLIPQNIAGKGLSYLLAQNKDFLGANLCIWPKYERNKLILNDHRNINSELLKEAILKKGGNNDFITNLQYLDLQTYLVDDILTKVDRASMMNSLEVRVPLLDHVFAELTFKIPWSLKLKGKSQKYIFRKTMSPYLPQSVITHQKQGFQIPLTAWFKEELKQYMHDTLLTRKPFFSEFLDKKYVQEFVTKSQSGMRDFSPRIWSLLFFEEWLKQNRTF